MLNHLVFQGRFVTDPEFNVTNSGSDVVNFRLAWSEKYKDKENKCFLECKAFGATAQFMQKYMNQKGQEILVEGKLTTEEWDGQDGKKRSKNVLLVSNVHFCGKRQEGTTPAAPAGTPVDTDEMPF